MTKELMNYLDKNRKYYKREDFRYNIFDVSIHYFCGMFNIELIGGWNDEEGVPEYGFGTNFGKDGYYPGFDKAITVALEDIRSSNEDFKIKNIAESALARACVEFNLMHHGML